MEHATSPGPTTRVRSGVVTPEQARAYDEQGFFVLEDAVDADDRRRGAGRASSRSTGRCSTSSRPSPTAGSASPGVDTVSIAHPRRAALAGARDFCTSPLFADLCHDLIGPDARLYWEQSVYKRPQGAEPVLWHQDNGYTYVEPQAYLTCWVALTDATLENGCVWVLPGVHRSGTVAHRGHADRVPVLSRTPTARSRSRCAPASIVVFSSLTPHATGRNTTDEVRQAYIVQYAPDGAVTLEGDPAQGAPTATRPAGRPSAGSSPSWSTANAPTP